MDIFEKVTSLTDDFDRIVEVVCPELRPSVYYLARIFSSEWEYSPDYAAKFLASVDENLLVELTTLIRKLSPMIVVEPTDRIEEIIKSVLEFSYSFTFGKTVANILKSLGSLFRPKSKLDTCQEMMFSIGEAILKTCNNISESKTYSELSKLLRDKSMVRPITFSILAIFRIVECRLVKTNLKDMEITRLCLLYWAAIMRYHLNNMHENVWLPQITNLMARNGGRYFRLCNITLLRGEASTPLYKALFPKSDLTRAVKPDWHDQLYSSLKISESLSTYKSLHKLFLFHIIDQFLLLCANVAEKDKRIESLFGKLQPSPCHDTIQRYFNLYLGISIYTEKTDCSLWEPDKLLYKLFMSRYTAYNECLDAMRKEYFPEDMFDLNSLISAACEFYDDKFHMDMCLNNITDFTMLDNVSIWLTAEWIINNRNYKFLDGVALNELADMIGSAITESTQ